MKRWLLPILLLAGCTASQSRHALQGEPLESAPAAPVAGRVLDDGGSIDGWRYYEVEGSLKPLTFESVEGALHLTSDGSAGLLWRAMRFEPGAEPLLQWRWRVSRTFDTSTPLAPEFDNFPARLLVGFDSGWKDAGPAALAWRRKVEQHTGVTPPARAICYTFGGTLESNEAVDAAFGEGRIVVINLRTPRDGTGWHTEVRDLASDYRSVYGEDPPEVMALGIGCDSHRLKTRVEAWFDDITLYGCDAYAQFRRQLAPSPQRRAPPLVWYVFAACALVAGGSAAVWLWLRRRGG
ncbi:MAG: DUF3047 domain-containing protein [Planctomycetes bacterium]|nr:DUF3047 domain-containing protein [Planctomycetota bacterium]MCB9936546.1 DUF3047 domain-containing protein [Planctomycetota bacterium]